MAVFRGRFIHTIDGKGRISIPVPFREIMGSQCDDVLVVTTLDRCLAAYPSRVWARIEEKTDNLSLVQPDVQAFLRIFYSGASDCRIDRQGRILVPPSLRSEARLDKDVVVNGVKNRIELWDKETWDDYLVQIQKNFGTVTDKLSQFGL
jgi:MraZ protein